MNTLKSFSKRKWIVLLLFMLVSVISIFCLNLEHTYKMRGETKQLLPDTFMGVSGYDYYFDENSGLYHFDMANDDPQFYLSDLKNKIGNIGGIEIEFVHEAGVTDIHKYTQIQIFYSKSGQNYSEKNSVKMSVRTADGICRIPVPRGQYDSLRFDIDDDVIIKRITSCADKMKANSYISQYTLERCMWYCPAAVIFIFVVFWTHSLDAARRRLKGRQYMQYVLFGAKPSPKRLAYWDYLRILAAVLVILAHTCSSVVDLADTDAKRLLLVCGLSLGLCCNILYVMLSGALLLSSQKEEKLSDFYIRRATKVIIPLVAYYMLLLYFNHEVEFFPPKGIAEAFKRMLVGAPDAGPHLWLIYTIIGLYIITPFMKVMVKNLSDKMIIALAFLILLFNALSTYLPLAGINFGITTFLSGWVGVFLLGYIFTRMFESPDKLSEWRSRLSRRLRTVAELTDEEIANVPNRESGRYFIMILVVAVLSYIISVYAVFKSSANMNFVYGCTVPIILVSSGIFVTFIRNKDWINTKTNLILRLCSKYSYSVILIHWYSLFVIVQDKFHINALRFGCIGGIALSVVLTFVVCLLIAIVFDNTVVIVLSIIFDRTIDFIRNLFSYILKKIYK